jgi:hypothetical protein
MGGAAQGRWDPEAKLGCLRYGVPPWLSPNVHFGRQLSPTITFGSVFRRVFASTSPSFSRSSSGFYSSYPPSPFEATSPSITNGLLSITSTVTTPRSVAGPLPMDEGEDVDGLENGKVKEYGIEAWPRRGRQRRWTLMHDDSCRPSVHDCGRPPYFFYGGGAKI